MTVLAHADISPQEFVDLVEGHSWPSEALLMGFTPSEARFCPFSLDGPFLVATEEGRVFSPAGELRWRRVGDLFRAVYLGAPPNPPGLADCSDELKEISPRHRRYFLWGERTDTRNEWLEQQVPHRFAYPVTTAQFPRGRIVVIVEEWLDAGGIPKFSRYVSIEETQGVEYAAG